MTDPTGRNDHNAGGAGDAPDRGSLAYTLAHMTPDMITPAEGVHDNRDSAAKRRKIIMTAIFVVSVCVFIGSLISILDKLSWYKRSEDFYSDLVKDMIEEHSRLDADLPAPPVPPFGSRVKAGESTLDRALYERMKSRLTALKAVNPDICGWINIPGTKHINYPILQASDNEYYLQREYTGGYLPAGSIFVDYRCDRDFNGNFNTVIYGHNMENGLMFSELINYLDEDFFRENKYVYIYTEYGVYTYEVFAVFKADYMYKYVETAFETHEEFIDFAYEMKSNSVFTREGIEFDRDSRIITLSTCTNARRTDRYAVQALLVDAYNG
ncbi:MAG: class B sortase [Clostridia bacterium]|nr:class B sortase [Clostridia bacterium]